MGGGEIWLAIVVEEAGGIEGTAILPPGGGGSRLRPPDPDTRGLAAPPFFVVMFYIKMKGQVRKIIHWNIQKKRQGQLSSLPQCLV